MIRFAFEYTTAGSAGIILAFAAKIHGGEDVQSFEVSTNRFGRRTWD